MQLIWKLVFFILVAIVATGQQKTAIETMEHELKAAIGTLEGDLNRATAMHDKLVKTRRYIELKLANLEKIMHERLIDQNNAVSVVAQAVRRGRAG